MSRKILSVILAVVILLSLAMPTFAVMADATDAADALHNLGLFNGTGTNPDGTPNYDLDRAPTRFEAVTMLVRLLGKEAEAKAGNWNIPFTDVVAWAKPYVGFAYSVGLTAGTSATTFGGSDTITASQYLTFVLRALGYESGKDFQWDKAWELSDKIGLTDGRYNAGSKRFLRGDVSIISNNALYMKLANKDETLLDSFNARGFGTLQQNEKTMNAGGNSCEVKIGNKIYENAVLATWAYEFNGEISEYMTASGCLELLKVLTKDYTIEETTNPNVSGKIVYDMSQTSRVGYSRWKASPKPGITQTWATYHYGGNKVTMALDNGLHADNVLYYVDGVRCFDRIYDNTQSTYVNVYDLLNRLGIKTKITFEKVAGIGDVWSFTDIEEFTPTPLPTPTTPENNKEDSSTKTEDVPTTPAPEKEEENSGNVAAPEDAPVIFNGVGHPTLALYNDKLYAFDGPWDVRYSSKDGETYDYDEDSFQMIFNPINIEKNDNPFTEGTISYENWTLEADGLSYSSKNNFEYKSKSEYISATDTLEVFTLTANGKTFESINAEEFLAKGLKNGDSGEWQGVRYCVEQFSTWAYTCYNMNDLAKYFGIENKSFHIEEAENNTYRWVLKDGSNSN